MVAFQCKDPAGTMDYKIAPDSAERKIPSIKKSLLSSEMFPNVEIDSCYFLVT